MPTIANASPKASIVGFYQSSGVESPHSVKGNDPKRDYIDEDPILSSPGFTPGVTGRNVVVRDAESRVIAGFMQVSTI